MDNKSEYKTDAGAPFSNLFALGDDDMNLEKMANSSKNLSR